MMTQAVLSSGSMREMACRLVGLKRALIQCSAVHASRAVAKEDGLLAGLPCFHACSVAKWKDIDPDS
jgi:hypothetical protein